MTSHPPGRQILHLSAPLVVSFWLRSAFQWVDTIFATKLEGLEDASVAAIGLAEPFEFLMIACWVGASSGFTARLAAAMGAHQGARIEQLVRATRRIIAVLIAVFLVLAAGIWFGADHAPLEADLARQFKIYTTVLLGGSAVTAFWSVLPDSLVKAHQDTRSTMWAGIWSSVVNVVLNALFVFVFHWGIFGIALSTVLGRLGGLAYAQRRANLHEARRREEGLDTNPELEPRPVRSILAIAVPAALTFVLMAVEAGAVNALLVRTVDQEANLAAWSVFGRAVRFLAMPCIAVGVAVLPVSARLFGAGRIPTLRLELRNALLACGLYVALGVAPLAVLLWPWVAGELASSPEAFLYALGGRAWLPLAVLVSAPIFVLRSAFEGVGRPRPAFASALLRASGVVLLTWLGLQLAPTLGQPAIVGAYAGSVLGMAVAAVLLVAWLRRTLASLEATPG